jgi:hypothetical protein
MGVSNLINNWRYFVSYEVTQARVDSVGYQSTRYKLTYDKGRPRFHTLDDSFTAVLLFSIVWSLGTAIPIGILFVLIYRTMVEMSTNQQAIIDGKPLFIFAGAVVAYLWGFKVCVKHLMTDQAKSRHSIFNLSAIDALGKLRHGGADLLRFNCVVEVPSFWLLLFTNKSPLRRR